MFHGHQHFRHSQLGSCVPASRWVTGQLSAGHYYRETHNAYSVADFVRSYLHIEGPATVVSTACSSSAKVFATAQRHDPARPSIDAAVVGGVDSLCLTTLYGFSSLQPVSPNPCSKPFDAQRDGISAGEGAQHLCCWSGWQSRTPAPSC